MRTMIIASINNNINNDDYHNSCINNDHGNYYNNNNDSNNDNNNNNNNNNNKQTFRWYFDWLYSNSICKQSSMPTSILMGWPKFGTGTKDSELLIKLFLFTDIGS